MSASFVPRVLSRLTEILTETIYKLFKDAKGKYTTNGIIQVHVCTSIFILLLVREYITPQIVFV